MFYSWNCSLTGRGAELAGRLILDKLKSFDSRQLATFGYTGVPLMAAAILQGDDRYTGLVIREARKVHGASRQIDGPADKSRPVVVIDNSLSSGTSLRQAVTALEEDGFRVEGAVVLVNFPYRGGLEWASALGYRVEWVFDAWEDLSTPKPAYVPGHKRLGGEKWAEERLPDGLHPAIAARRVTEHLSAHRGHADAAAALRPRGRRARRRLCQLSRALQRPPAGTRGLLAFRSGGRRPLPRLGAGDGQDL